MTWVFKAGRTEVTEGIVNVHNSVSKVCVDGMATERLVMTKGSMNFEVGAKVCC